MWERLSDRFFFRARESFLIDLLGVGVFVYLIFYLLFVYFCLFGFSSTGVFLIGLLGMGAFLLGFSGTGVCLIGL